ncbi:MAG: Cobyrinic acid A,C-diamide synthase [Candidatus Izimaplasma bacterium HR2]|nr:MAG: Cobyrinic acid A,C-diamide synthase [Candidatus Izimaplasma bacterium HR2]
MKTIIIAGTNSGVGKTTITKALLTLIDNAQAFKMGPDFIDPSFYRYITKRNVYNLDLFCYQEDKLKYVFNRYKKSINIIEGVMGLYGGLGFTLDNHSTAHTARTLDAPILLVVDGKHKDSSIQAEVLGYIKRDERLNIKGVIINNVSKKMYQYLSNALQEINIKTYGYLPKVQDITIPERHLGLLQAQDIDNLDLNLNRLKEVANETIDVGEIVKDFDHTFNYQGIEYFDIIKDIFLNKTIAITKDESFSFFYDLHLEMLKCSGANIVYFSPLHDTSLPTADLYYFSGGYPEIYVEELSKNTSIFKEIKETSKAIYAECGGYIYLSKSILINNKKTSLVNLFFSDIVMTKMLDFKHFGYLDIITKDGYKIKGHEFHYSKLIDSKEKDNYYNVVNKEYITGVIKENIKGGYPHILWLSNLEYYKKIFNGGKDE